MRLRTRRMRAMKRSHRDTTGPRCRTFCTGCITCASWHYLDAFGKRPAFFLDASLYNDLLVVRYGDDIDCVPWTRAHEYAVPMPRQHTEMEQAEWERRVMG